MEKGAIDVCEVSVIHEDVLARVKRKMPAEEPVYEVSELFKVFGDTTRARIICALNIEEMCVCDLAALLNKEAFDRAGLIYVKSRKQGRVVYYSLDDTHIGQIFAMAFDHVMEEMEG